MRTYSVTYEIADMFNLKAVDQRVPWPEDPKELEKYLHDLGTDIYYHDVVFSYRDLNSSQ
jgi:hypothetical protein